MDNNSKYSDTCNIQIGAMRHLRLTAGSDRPAHTSQIVLRQSLCNSRELMDHVTLVAGALSNQSRSDCLLVSPANNRGNGVLSCGDVKYVEAMHGGALQRSVRAVRQYALDDVLTDVEHIAMIKMVREMMPPPPDAPPNAARPCAPMNLTPSLLILMLAAKPHCLCLLCSHLSHDGM